MPRAGADSTDRSPRTRTSLAPERSTATAASASAARMARARVVDRTAEPPGVRELDDPVNRRRFAGCDKPEVDQLPPKVCVRSARARGDVGEDRPGLHRRQLIRVTDQHQPRAGSDRLEQPGHHRQRDHRHLVDDHDVVRQLVVRVVAEPAAAPGQPAEQPVQRRPPRDRRIRAGPRVRAGRGVGPPPPAGPRPCRSVRPARSAALVRAGRASMASSLGHRRRLAGARARRPAR